MISNVDSLVIVVFLLLFQSPKTSHSFVPSSLIYHNAHKPHITDRSRCRSGRINSNNNIVMADPTNTANESDTTPPPKKERIQWTVRPATLEDREKVNALLYASYSKLLSKDYESDFLVKVLPDLTSARESLLTCGTWYVVHHPDRPGTLVGCGGWTLDQPAKTDGSLPSSPHLRHFATEPKMTRQGVARALWERTWNDITEMVGTNTILEVFSTLTAESFYASLGFETVKHMTLPIRAGCDFPCTFMRRDPSASSKP